MTLFRSLSLALLLGLLGLRPYQAAAAMPGWIRQSHDLRGLPAVLTPDGRTVPLELAAGQTTLLHFWASWCAPCLEELPALAALAAAHAGPDVRFLTLSEDRDPVALRRFLAHHPDSAALPVYIDPDRRIAHALHLDSVPVTVVVDGRGMERARLTGSGRWQGADGARLVEILGHLTSR